MTAVWYSERHHRIAWVRESRVYCEICTHTRNWPDIHELCCKELHCYIHAKKLDFVDVNATRIDSLSSPTMRKLETLCQVSSFFRVPVPEICYYRFANSWARNVLRCDQWDAVAEPLVVILKCLKHFVICSFWIQFQDHRLTNSNAVDNKEFLTSAAPKECFPMLALKKRKMMHLILLLNPSMRSNRFYPEFASKNATPRQARSEIWQSV